MIRILTVTLFALMLASCAGKHDEMELIDFATQHGGRFVHGTLSLVHGASAGTWTIHDGAANETYDTPISIGEFHDLWRDVHAMSALEPFALHDDGTRLSPSDHYVMGLAWIDGADSGYTNYMVPHDGAPSEVAELMHRIETISEKR